MHAGEEGNKNYFQTNLDMKLFVERILEIIYFFKKHAPNHPSVIKRSTPNQEDFINLIGFDPKSQ